MSKFDEIYDMIDEMEDCSDVRNVSVEIDDAYENGEITLKEKETLLNHFDEESLRIPLIDDHDWELMKLSDPNLSDQ